MLEYVITLLGASLNHLNKEEEEDRLAEMRNREVSKQKNVVTHKHTNIGK